MICNLCGSSHCNKQLSLQDKYSVMKCSNCGLSFLDPIPSQEELEKIYSKDYYFSTDSNQTGYSDYKKDMDLIVLTAIRRYRMIMSKIKNSNDIKLLDVGCAYGYFLDIARLYGWDMACLNPPKFPLHSYGRRVHCQLSARRSTRLQQ